MNVATSAFVLGSCLNVLEGAMMIWKGYPANVAGRVFIQSKFVGVNPQMLASVMTIVTLPAYWARLSL